jgi:hypothetical protein
MYVQMRIRFELERIAGHIDFQMNALGLLE